MRLLSYNIHKGAGNDRRYRLGRIIEVIEAEQADLICLQEVDFNVRRSNFDDQPRLLAQQFQAIAHCFQLNVPRREGGYGNLVLSRWPFVLVHHVSLRQRQRKPRGAQLVVVDSPEGPFQLINWHLGLLENERHWQVNHLLHHPHFLSAAHLPTLITGDFNDWRNRLEERCFRSHHFHQATAPLRHFRSFPSFWGMMALDKLFYRGALKITRARIVRSPLARQASDHLPLVIDFHLLAPRRQPVHHAHPGEAALGTSPRTVSSS